MNDSLPAGVILAGGRSRRMQGKTKALLAINDLPLLQHVMNRLSPQVSTLFLSVEQKLAEFEPFGLQQIEDILPAGQGPLCGLLSAMESLGQRQEYLLMVPCDAPLTPLDLGEKLALRMSSSGSLVSSIRYEGQVQPTFSLWNRRVLPDLNEAVTKKGIGGFKQFFERVDVSFLDWPAESVSPFFNVNTPADLEKAKAAIRPVYN